MFKFIICVLLTLSLTSCQEDEDDPKNNPKNNPKGPAEPTTTPDETTIDPKGKYKLVNKTGDGGVVKVILFKSSEKLKNNDSTDCAPVVLQAEQCLTIIGGQFPLLQIVLDEEKVCGTTTTFCNPDNYEVTDISPWWHLFPDYHLSTLTEERKKAIIEERKKAEEEESKKPAEPATEQDEDDKEGNKEEKVNLKTCTPLECKKPAEPATEQDEDDKEGNKEES